MLHTAASTGADQVWRLVASIEVLAQGAAPGETLHEQQQLRQGPQAVACSTLPGEPHVAQDKSEGQSVYGLTLATPSGFSMGTSCRMKCRRSAAAQQSRGCSSSSSMPAIMWLLGVSQGCTRADTKTTCTDNKGE